MSLEDLGWVMVIAGVLLIVLGYAYIVGSKTLDRWERELSMMRHPAGTSWGDLRITVFERLPLYDWQEEGEL